MKKAFFLTLVVLICSRAISQAPLYAVNPVIGDQSFTETFGTLPSGNTDELLRVQTHLQYAAKFLGQRNTDGLTPSQKQNRAKVLDLLNEYAAAGVFPANHDYPGERKPCFIDREGNICAVGYLVEQTVGRDIAEAINKDHQYDFIADMNEPVVEDWANEYGLTLEECAIIQPAYGGWPPAPWPPAPTTTTDKVNPGYGISSGILGGSNIAFTIINISQMQKLNGNKTVPVLGLLAGTAQMVLGIAKAADKDFADYGGRTEKTLTYTNIAMGTTSIITSAWNLIMNRKMKERKTSFNMFSYPNPANSMTVGFSLTKSI